MTSICTAASSHHQRLHLSFVRFVLIEPPLSLSFRNARIMLSRIGLTIYWKNVSSLVLI